MPLTPEATNEILKVIKNFEEHKEEPHSEDDVCRAYILPLFRALGWKVENPSEVKGQKSQPQGRPDYIFYLNGTIAFFLEAKKFGELTTNDIKQAVNYARNKNKRWAVLSNFQDTYILICDTKEKDLRRHIFRAFNYSVMDARLDDLYLLSRESFEKGIIEQEAQILGRTKRTIKIDEELLDDVLNWRKRIIHSIKENNKKEYSKEDLEEIAQILLNRIVFIRTVEDRNHEAKPDEFIKNIVTQYENNKNINIKKRLNELFEGYDKVYDSRLFTYDENDFSIRHECEKVDIDNNTLYKTLKETFDKDAIYTYNFADIDVDVLGAMYEKYIGIIQAKSKGSYYTPTYVVEHIVKNTLGEKLKECKKPKDIEEIKVLDPACGSGSFLIDAFDEIDAFNKEKSWNEQATIDANSTKGFVTAKDRILKQNIYGVDLDPKAVEIAQLNLLLKTSETKHRLPILKENIKIGDSLIQNPEITKHSFVWKDEFEKIMFSGGFDTVIGNPPWVSFGLRNVGKLDKKENEYYRTNYKSAEYKLSTYALFIERGIGLLKENGYFAFILPDSFLLGRYFSKLRRYILDTCKIQEILITFYDVFSGKATTGRNVILVLKKTKDKTKRISNKVKIIKVNTLKEFQNKKFETFGYTQEYFENMIYNRFRLFFNKEEKDFVEKTEQNSKPLSDYMIGHTGVRALIGQKNIVGKSQKSKTWKKGLISGSQIGKYWSDYQGDFINIEPKLLNKGGWDSEVILNDKIMIRQTGDRIYATIDKDKYYHLNNIHSFNLKNEKLAAPYILALLNSKLMSAYYLLTTLEKNRVMAQTDIETLEKLPIKEISEAQQKPFIELVEQLIVLNKQLKEVENRETSKKQEIKSEIEKKEKKLDNLVYQLYRVEESQNLIEKALN